MPLYGKRTFLFHTIPKQLEIYVKLLKMYTLPSLAGFCEVINILVDFKGHISEWRLTQGLFWCIECDCHEWQTD